MELRLSLGLSNTFVQNNILDARFKGPRGAFSERRQAFELKKCACGGKTAEGDFR